MNEPTGTIVKTEYAVITIAGENGAYVQHAVDSDGVWNVRVAQSGGTPVEVSFGSDFPDTVRSHLGKLEEAIR